MIVAGVLLFLPVLFVSLLLAPLEALGWWAGWFGSSDDVDGPAEERAERAAATEAPAEAELYVVYLDGIAKAARSDYEDVAGFLARLRQELPRAVVIDEVLPYSPSRRPLVEGRPLAGFWQRMLALKLQGRQPLLTMTINARNLLQVLVASDRRYGAVYGHTTAAAIEDALSAHGRSRASRAPVALVGYSGGAQVALVAAPFLRRRLGAPMRLVSLAGVMANEPGVLAFERMLHIESSRDRIARIGRVIFPGLWGVGREPYLSRLARSGALEVVDPGPMRHNDADSYLDDAAVLGGRSHRDITVELIAGFLAARPDAAHRPNAGSRPAPATPASG